MANPRYLLILADLPDEAIERIRRIAAPLCVQRVRRDEPAYADLLPRAEVIVGGISARGRRPAPRACAGCNSAAPGPTGSSSCCPAT